MTLSMRKCKMMQTKYDGFICTLLLSDKQKRKNLTRQAYINKKGFCVSNCKSVRALETDTR